MENRKLVKIYINKEGMFQSQQITELVNVGHMVLALQIEKKMGAIEYFSVTKESSLGQGCLCMEKPGFPESWDTCQERC